jgi:tetratricopeptide (TPR) repeat protein
LKINKIKKYVLVSSIAYLLNMPVIFAQLNIDSLKTVLNSLTDVNKKSQSFIDISWEYMILENDSSLIYSQKGFEYAKQHNYSFGMITNLEMKGVYLEYVLNDYTNASKVYLDAIKIAEQSDDKYISSLYLSLGTLFNQIDDKIKAKEYYKLATVNAKKHKQDIVVKLSLINLGSIYSFEKNYPLALKTLQESLTYKSHDLYNNHVAYFNIAEIYKDQGKYKEAEKFYAKSIGKSSKINDARYFDHYSKLLETKILINNLKGIDTLIIVSEHFLKNMQSSQKKTNLLETLAKIYKIKGDYKKALFYKEIYLKLNDSISKNKRDDIIYDMEQKYQSNKKQLIIEKKDAQLSMQKQLGIALGIFIILLLGLLYYVRKANKFKRLNEYNTIKTNKLEIEQKVLRNQMNPHFIFNALNSIQSYVSDNNTTNAELYLAKFSRLIRLILENSRKEFVPFKEDYISLESYLSLEQIRFDHTFEFKITYQDECENINIPPMLIQPFVENAIKHGISSLSEKGEIVVSFNIIENIYDNDNAYGIVLCKITDNGIGVDEAEKRKKDSFTKHKSLSISLIKDRLKNYTKITKKNYNIDIKNAKNNGTIVTIEMPYIL